MLPHFKVSYTLSNHVSPAFHRVEPWSLGSRGLEVPIPLAQEFQRQERRGVAGEHELRRLDLVPEPMRSYGTREKKGDTVWKPKSF